jgi:hypothetical protein
MGSSGFLGRLISARDGTRGDSDAVPHVDGGDQVHQIHDLFLGKMLLAGGTALIPRTPSGVAYLLWISKGGPLFA